jgi:hypothetical protein
MLTKISSALRERREPDVPTAWACLASNLLVLPGLGSCVAGRWISGIGQIVVSVFGFIITLLWLVAFVRSWMSSHQMPADLGPQFGKALLGLAIFLFAWCWALVTSLFILSKAYSAAQK